MYKCKVCGEEFDVIGKLGAHMGHKHPKNKEQVCKVCGAVFTNGGLRGHMNVHSTKPVTDVECKICGKPFNTRTIKGHMAMVHPKNGLPHPAVARISKVWEGLTEEEHLERVKLVRDSRFKGNDDIELTYIQRQMILGSLLGDMNIHRQHKNVTGIAYPELHIAQSTKQAEYVHWKFNILRNIARDKGVYTILQKSGFGAGLFMCKFETRALKCLNEIYDLVKDGNDKRTITEKWLNEIDHPIALAAWFMDDGSKKPYISLGISSKQEQDIVQQWMLKKWGIHTHIYSYIGNYNGNTYYNLMIDDKIQFVELIKDHMIPSMMYKI